MSFNSNRSQGRQPPIIRAGLSVQELKAMTAMRMAQSDQAKTISHAPYNPATSYQTATPQQLQAAGITPIVINDRSRALRGFRGHVDETVSLRNNVYNAGRPQLSQLSPYHQQILPNRRIETGLPPMESNSRRVDTFDTHLHWNRNEESRQLLDDSRFISDLDRSSANGRIFDAGSDIVKTPRAPDGFLPAINNGPRYFRGPEVRSPAAGSDRSSGTISGERGAALFPDEESEQYPNEVFFGMDLSQLQQQSDALAGLNRRPPLNRALSTPSFVPEGNSSMPPSNGSGPISSISLAALQYSSSPESGMVDPIRSELFTVESSTESPASGSKFPFKKSKTAPKLGIISPTGLSPIESPNLKILSRKNSINLSPIKDRCTPIDSFLASEVAEAVLDTPSNNSTPLIRNKFLSSLHQDSTQRLSLNPSIQPILLSNDRSFFVHGTFLGEDVRDERLEWNVSEHSEERVSNQREENLVAEEPQNDSDFFSGSYEYQLPSE